MLTVGTKNFFHDASFRDKVLLWHCNNESKNNISAPANKQLQSRPQTPKSQSASPFSFFSFFFSRNFFFSMLQNEHGKVESTTLEP